MIRLFALAILCLTLALPARAQDAATLLADRVEIRADTFLVAEGNVEVLWRGARLTARRITYDRAGDRLAIDGPITLTEGESVALFADFAELSPDLQNGLLTSARLVLEQQLQLAAAEIHRVEGRYTQLSKVVASSCQVCAGRPTPLWSIRARRVVHDAEARQLYFDGAQLRVLDLPVLYIPRLRLPDPTLRRATGFMFPTLRTTSKLGTGLRLPHFITLGQSADVMLTPYLSPDTRTLGLRYRQAFRRGGIVADGAITSDEILPGDTRGYLFVSSAFALAGGFTLGARIETVSDPAYLLDYGLQDRDRLRSALTLTRTRADEQIDASLSAYHTLRSGESNSTQPGIVYDAAYERRFTPGPLGGSATLSLGALGTRRSSDLDGDGRDVMRLDARLGWERTEVLGPGLLATGAFGLRAAAYDIRQDSAFPGEVLQLSSEAAVTLRWPLMKTGQRGAMQILEPVAMIAWSEGETDSVPNEDSRLVEFDEGNLLSFSRFPGEDARDRGLRAALGVNWVRRGADGGTLGLTFGRLFRDEDRGDFADGSGLTGTSSHWLVAGRVDLPSRLALSGRALLDDDFSAAKTDLRLAYNDARFDVATGVTFLSASIAENRPEETAEWALDAAWRIDSRWTGRTAWRYDFVAERATSAGVGLGFENECLRVDLSLSRRFTSSTSVTPTTDFGLSVALTGFGTGGEGGAPRRRCIN